MQTKSQLYGDNNNDHHPNTHTHARAPTKRGLASGQVNWNAQLNSSVFELATKMPGRTIQVERISTPTDAADTAALHSHQAALRLVAVGDKPDKSDNLASVGAALAFLCQTSGDDDDDEQQDACKQTGQASSSSYMRTHAHNSLEIVANRVRLRRKQSSSGNNQQATLVDAHAQAKQVSLSVNDASHNVIRVARGNSLHVTDELDCRAAAIEGSLEADLHVQSHDAPLTCTAQAHLTMRARSGPASIGSLDDLTIRAPRVTLQASAGVFLASGIEYFDSADEQTGANLVDLQPDSGDQRPSLGAYELLAVDGILIVA